MNQELLNNALLAQLARRKNKVDLPSLLEWVDPQDEPRVKYDAWTNLFCITTLMLCITLFCTCLERSKLRKQAIERGYAEYIVDSNGKINWKWKDKQ